MITIENIEEKTKRIMMGEKKNETKKIDWDSLIIENNDVKFDNIYHDVLDILEMVGREDLKYVVHKVVEGMDKDGCTWKFKVKEVIKILNRAIIHESM